MAKETLMVMLHGYGSNGDDLLSLAPYFAPLLPDTHFFSPDGLETCELGVYGYQWFSLLERSPEFINKQLAAKAPQVRKMIKDKAKELGLTEADVILLGFSQGASMISYLALSSDASYKAVISFSGWVFLPNEVKNTKTPICLVHGAADDVVPCSSMTTGVEQLTAAGCNVSSLVVPNLTHSIDIQGLEFAANFLKRKV